MFDFFRKRTATDFVKEAKENYVAPVVKPVEQPKPDPVVYRVGKTEEGKVTLSLGNYSGVVVTMNNSGVDTLIRILEAAKNPEGEQA